jgi:hypothetical protein
LAKVPGNAGTFEILALGAAMAETAATIIKLIAAKENRFIEITSAELDAARKGGSNDAFKSAACAFASARREPIYQNSVLESELRGQLDQARSGRADDLSEVGIVHFSIHRRGSIELGMIEYVERLQPELK